MHQRECAHALAARPPRTGACPATMLATPAGKRRCLLRLVPPPGRAGCPVLCCCLGCRVSRALRYKRAWQQRMTWAAVYFLPAGVARGVGGGARGRSGQGSASQESTGTSHKPRSTGRTAPVVRVPAGRKRDTGTDRQRRRSQPSQTPAPPFGHNPAPAQHAASTRHRRSPLFLTPRSGLERFLRSLICLRDFCTASARPFCGAKAWETGGAGEGAARLESLEAAARKGAGKGAPADGAQAARCAAMRLFCCWDAARAGHLRRTTVVATDCCLTTHCDRRNPVASAASGCSCAH